MDHISEHNDLISFNRYQLSEPFMFSLFKKDPVKKLKKDYMQKLEQAMNAQRNGDIKLYSAITSEADVMHKEIQKLEANAK